MTKGDAVLQRAAGDGNEPGGSGGSPIRVFVLDDHAVIREGVRSLLASKPDIEVVGEADTVADALKSILRLTPDVALIDARLPDGSGIEMIREVRSRNRSIRCVVFTSYADDEAFFHSVVAGAAGYLVKEASPGELASAIREVAAGRSLIRRETIDDLRRRASSRTSQHELLANLTGQERRILEMITRGMTNREIALELSLAEKTVRNYVSNILGKVGMKNRTQLAAYVVTAARLADR